MVCVVTERRGVRYLALSLPIFHINFDDVRCHYTVSVQLPAAVRVFQQYTVSVQLPAAVHVFQQYAVSVQLPAAVRVFQQYAVSVYRRTSSQYSEQPAV